jgi:hypothetical protein
MPRGRLVNQVRTPLRRGGLFSLSRDRIGLGLVPEEIYKGYRLADSTLLSAKSRSFRFARTISHPWDEMQNGSVPTTPIRTLDVQDEFCWQVRPFKNPVAFTRLRPLLAVQIYHWHFVTCVKLWGFQASAYVRG